MELETRINQHRGMSVYHYQTNSISRKRSAVTAPNLEEPGAAAATATAAATTIKTKTTQIGTAAAGVKTQGAHTFGNGSGIIRTRIT